MAQLPGDTRPPKKSLEEILITPVIKSTGSSVGDRLVMKLIVYALMAIVFYGGAWYIDHYM